eukprot:UN24808
MFFEDFVFQGIYYKPVDFIELGILVDSPRLLDFASSYGLSFNDLCSNGTYPIQLCHENIQQDLSKYTFDGQHFDRKFNIINIKSDKEEFFDKLKTLQYDSDVELVEKIENEIQVSNETVWELSDQDTASLEQHLKVLTDKRIHVDLSYLNLNSWLSLSICTEKNSWETLDLCFSNFGVDRHLRNLNCLENLRMLNVSNCSNDLTREFFLPLHLEEFNCLNTNFNYFSSLDTL